MNVCIISRELYPFTKAGIGTYVYDMAKVLANRGHMVFIITDLSEYDTKFNIHDNIKIIPLMGETDAEFFGSFSLAYSYRVYKTLIQLNKNETINLVEVPDYLGEGYFIIRAKRELGYFRDIPIVLKLHTPTYECNELNGICPPENNTSLQEDYCIRNSDYIYAISFAMKSKIEQRLNISTPIPVVYNPNDFVFNSYTQHSSTVSDEKRILFVGRLERRKGVDVFVDAAIKLLTLHRDVKFQLIGNDTLDKKSGRSTMELLLSIIPEQFHNFFEFKSAIPRSELAIYYSEAYVSVFPSRWEGFGSVCVEAMSCGCPVIVSDSGGMMEIIDNGKYGLPFLSGSVEDLFNKLDDILMNVDLHAKLKEKAKFRCKYFNEVNFYKRQLDLYNAWIQNPDPRHSILNSTNQSLPTLEQWEEAFEKHVEKIKEIKRLNQEWAIADGDKNSLFNEVKRIWGECEKERSLRLALQLGNDELTKNYKEISIELDELKNSLEFVVQKNNTLSSELNALKKNIENRKWLLRKLFISRSSSN